MGPLHNEEADILNQKQSKVKWAAPLLSSLAVLAGVAAAGGGLVAYKSWQISQSAGGPPPETPTFVEVAIAQPIAFRQSTSAIGTLVASQWITLSNEVAGTVAMVNLSPGARVQQGTVLLQLDTSTEVAQLESAKAAAKMARSRYIRTQEAFQSGALTALEMDEADSQLAQANAFVSELEAMIRKKTLIAPFDARIGLSNTHIGQYLPSGTQITSLQSIDDFLYVDFTMTQQVAHVVSVGQTVAVISGDTSLNATITALDSQTDKLTRNRMARAKVDSIPEFMKPGDSVKVVIEYGPQVQSVAIPAQAVRRTPAGTQVFVAVKDETGNLRAQQRNIEVIQSIGNSVAIGAGVEVGESIVSSGSFKLMDNGLLQVTAGNAAGEPTQVSNQL